MNRFLLSLLLSISLFSCRNDLDTLHLQRDILTPIAKTSLSIQDLLGDSSLQSNADQTLSIVHRQDIHSYSFAPLLDTIVQVASFSKGLTLENLEIAPTNISQQYTLGELLIGAGLDGQNVLGTTIQDGGELSSLLVNLLPPMDLPAIPLDISQYFTTATLKEGYLDLVITNDLPFVLTNVDAEIRNTDDGTLIFSENFTNINPGEQATRTVDLAAALGGSPIKGQLTVLLTGVTLRTNQPKVTLDYTNSLDMTATLRGLKIQSAEAVFPAQEVFSNAEEVLLEGMDDVEVTYGIIRNGGVSIRAYNTLPDSLYIDYIMPEVTRGGVPFTFQTAVAPGSIANPTYSEATFAFDDYEVDFRGKNHDKTNTFYNIVTGRIEESPHPIPLSLDDSIFVELQVTRTVPSYLEGFLGKKTERVTGSVAFDFLDDLPLDKIELEKVNMNLVVENGLGAPGEIQINQIAATTNEGDIFNLTLDQNTTAIPSATNNRGAGNATPSTTLLNIPGAEDLLNSNPDHLHYDIEVLLNPNGNVPAFQNFAYYESALITAVDMEIPLSFAAKDLVLQDTITFLESAPETPESIKNGQLFLIADNGFPLSVAPTLYFLDAEGTITDSLSSIEIIQAAIIPNGSNRVEEKLTSKIPYNISTERLQHLLAAKTIIVQAAFSTATSREFQKIYDDYSIDFHLTGKFTLETSERL